MEKNWSLFKAYLLAGAFTFSGGMAMLPVIEKELCEKKKYISKDDLYEYTALSQTFPGVIALTNACFVGKKINGTSGMFVAGIGAILPAYVLMTIATLLYQLIPQDGPILTALTAVRATSAAFLFAAAYTIARYSIQNKLHGLFAGLCFGLTVFQLIGAPWIILAAGLLGISWTFIKKEKN
ncbi:chromate transporter [Enterococcus saccharolyticus]|uniref:Chromate transporter n=1 Tax=Candidatus Enterococcus willemsii TaxID=1857215 RepID=A0ABQ6Z1M5_9ENTE|nr:MULTISPECIES: chromate transporter [Enterococcus]KAF1305370.1 hypothetical protein BAU17_13475 [Enterococcus sp. CU12B]MCD5000904.1 chromate transporter [Enterococcus saccharolyticus]